MSDETGADEARAELIQLWEWYGSSVESDSSEGRDLADAILAAGYRKVEVTDGDIQRGVDIALNEGLAGRTWPEYIRAVYDAVSTRPAALGGGE